MNEDLRKNARQMADELCTAARLKPGDLVVVGCSSSEVLGEKIGTFSSEDTAKVIFDAVYSVFKSRGVFLAAQCCEHLNRALILEKEAAEKFGLEPVNVVPQPKAGGSFATAAYRAFSAPCAVEELHCASAGIDIGDTFIGMHMKKVCVPLRLSLSSLGRAHVTFARTRPKFIGGERAHYDDSMK